MGYSLLLLKTPALLYCSVTGCLTKRALYNGFSSYQTVAFLASKLAEATLKVFKAYHKEAECQTGRKLKRIRLDMGRKWFNNIWEQYHNDKGLIFEFTTPYAHQQNRVAKRGMQTILEAT